MPNPLKFLNNIPPKRRYFQIANWAIATLFGRSMELIHIVEYPRCGGTWIRHMLQDALDVPQYAMDRHLTRGTIIQTHSLPQPAIRKPIVVLRDPRDTMVSFYFKKIAFDDHLRQGETFKAGSFVHDPDRATKQDFFEFLKSHLVHPEHPRFHFRDFVQKWVSERNAFTVKYEDCKRDAAQELVRMVEYLDKPVDKEKIEWAVDENSFEKRTRKRSGRARKPGETDTGQFERKGIVGDWKNVFNAASARLFDLHEGQTLVQLGYEQDSSWVECASEAN